MHADTIVTGAGTAGSAVAHGLPGRGQTSVAPNAGDLHANFGLDRAPRRPRIVSGTGSCRVRPQLELFTVGKPAALAPPGMAQ